MRVVVAPQELKGTLTAAEAAEAIAAGVRDALPDAALDVVPMSDGGAGLVDALLAVGGGRRVTVQVHDPLMRPVDARFGLLTDGSAAIEMSAASGLVLLRAEELDPFSATTYGTGELICAALDRDCKTVIVGVGGSATVDGGAGAMQALGVHLLDPGGKELPLGGAALARLDRIDLSTRDPRISGVRIRVACDVKNTLCGPRGAAEMFGPQKGARAEQIPVLDEGLRRLAAIASRDAAVDVLDVPGGGAAGGLAAGLMIGAGASLEPGFPFVAESVGLEARIAAADAVITGEGRLDAQTAYGKTVDGVAGLARKHGLPVAIVAGSVDRSAATRDQYDVVEEATPRGTTTEDARRLARGFVRDAAARAARSLAALVRQAPDR